MVVSGAVASEAECVPEGSTEAEDLEGVDSTLAELAAVNLAAAHGRVLVDSGVLANSAVLRDQVQADSAAAASAAPVANSVAPVPDSEVPATEQGQIGLAQAAAAGPDLAIEASVLRAPPATASEPPAATNSIAFLACRPIKGCTV